MNTGEKINKILDHWGRDLQFMKAIEEAGEFVAAAGRFMIAMDQNNPKILDKANTEMINEIADLTIMMMQMNVIFGDDINKRIDYKLVRTLKRIDGEESNQNQTEMFMKEH